MGSDAEDDDTLVSHGVCVGASQGPTASGTGTSRSMYAGKTLPYDRAHVGEPVLPYGGFAEYV
jgi:hypothetical protein